jgi:hypothetical protein
MKLTFVILCIILCIILFGIYSHTTFNRKILNTLIKSTNNLVKITYPSENHTFNATDYQFQRSLDLKIPSFPNRRFAIFACSIHSTIYAYTFYTPIIALSWKRIGYETIVIFVGDFTLPNVLTSRLNLSRNYLKHVGAYIIDIQCDSSYSIKVSQLVRIFAGFLPDSIVHDDDDILTSDSDLMPLKPSEYLPTIGTDGFIFNANCCGEFKRRERSYKMFPS